MYTLNDFTIDIPEELVAQEPTASRTASRLLVARKDTVMHSQVKHLADFLPPRSLLIMNNSKVLPARLYATTKNGAKVEIFLVQKLEDLRWQVIAKPFKKLKIGETYALEGGHGLKVEAIHHCGEHHLPLADVHFDLHGADLRAWLDHHAMMPLPPYIKRTSALDKERYQTVYAQNEGSVAAPTAGLHFDQHLLGELQRAGHELRTLQLHVGGGTFFPIKTERIEEHQMHEEEYTIPSSTVDAIIKARSENRSVILVGTTTLRALESLGKASSHDIDKAQRFCDRPLKTSIFIYPQSDQLVRPWIGDALFTNFHQSQSSLLLLVSAIFGRDKIFSIYQEAIRERYRFFSYGDASLLWM